MSLSNRRILVVDDNAAIHADFRKILAGLGSQAERALADAEATLFGGQTKAVPTFELVSAMQGEEALKLAGDARAAGRPFALSFVDVRMPPGIDGIETAMRLWQIDPDLQVVLCTAYADYSWRDMIERLGATDRWVVLKKPFDNVEVLQLAGALGEKWALHARMREHLADLEQRVAARTADLLSALERLQRESAGRLRAQEERRLLERRSEVNQRLESLGVLAGGIAHDFNNLLTTIMGSASLVRMELGRGSKSDVFLERIEQGSRRAAELCEKMLTYAGQTRLEPTPIDLEALVRDALGMARVSMPADVAVSVETGQGLPPVRGDPQRLRQAVINLVLNAAEALGGAPRRIDVAVRRTELTRSELDAQVEAGDVRPGAFVLIEVRDTGCGMDPDTLKRIFEPFFSTKFIGRGLGLCVVLGVVRAHEGALGVTTAPGQGTTFRLFLPVAPAAGAPGG